MSCPLGSANVTTRASAEAAVEAAVEAALLVKLYQLLFT